MGRPGITWRRGRDSNPRGSSPGCFQDSCLKPLGHLSGEIVRPQSSQRQSQASTGNNSDLGVCLSSMPVNWKGRVAIRDLSRRSRGDFQPIDAPNPRAARPHPLALRSLRPGPLLLARRRGIFVVGEPPHPPSRAKPLQPFPGFPRSDVLVWGRTSLARYCAHTEQVPLSLNTSSTEVGAINARAGGVCFANSPFFRLSLHLAFCGRICFAKTRFGDSYRSILRPDLILVPSAATAKRSQLGCRHRVRVQQIRPSHRVC